MSNDSATKADKLESLIADPETNLSYALRAVILELSNESGIHVTEPGLAGHFYTIVTRELADSTKEHEQRGLRHLEVLLDNPTDQDIAAIVEYLDSDDPRYLRADPFPEGGHHAAN